MILLILLLFCVASKDLEKGCRLCRAHQIPVHIFGRNTFPYLVKRPESDQIGTSFTIDLNTWIPSPPLPYLVGQKVLVLSMSKFEFLWHSILFAWSADSLQETAQRRREATSSLWTWLSFQQFNGPHTLVLRGSKSAFFFYLLCNLLRLRNCWLWIRKRDLSFFQFSRHGSKST